MNVKFDIPEDEYSKIAFKFGDYAKGIPLKDMQSIAKKASKPLIVATRRAAPRSATDTLIYRTAKVIRGLRTPRGRGQVRAIIKPGNLSRSIGNLPLRKAYGAVVGPKRSSTLVGVYGNSRKSSGYYGHMVERGTVNIRNTTAFMAKGLQVSRGNVEQLLANGITTYLNNIIKL
jgi:hypothetical protein